MSLRTACFPPCTWQNHKSNKISVLLPPRRRPRAADLAFAPGHRACYPQPAYFRSATFAVFDPACIPAFPTLLPTRCSPASLHLCLAASNLNSTIRVNAIVQIQAIVSGVRAGKACRRERTRRHGRRSRRPVWPAPALCAFVGAPWPIALCFGTLLSYRPRPSRPAAPQTARSPFPAPASPDRVPLAASRHQKDPRPSVRRERCVWPRSSSPPRRAPLRRLPLHRTAPRRHRRRRHGWQPPAAAAATRQRSNSTVRTPRAPLQRRTPERGAHLRPPAARHRRQRCAAPSTRGSP